MAQRRPYGARQACRRLLVAALLASTTVVAAPATAWDADYGRVARGDGTLRGGCHDYPFRYRLRPGSQDWGVELFLIGPGGEGLGTVNRLSGADPKRGRGEFGMCRSATRPGRFRIRGKLTVITGYDTEVHWIKPVRFRLRRP